LFICGYKFAAARLEEREADQKNEFDKLHERYNVLLRTHIDHMERTKYLMGSDKFDMMQSMPLPSQQLRTKIGMATSLDAGSIRGVSDLISAHMSQSTTMDVNLANHISNEADWQEEFGQSGAEILQSPRDDSSSTAESLRVEQQPESTPEEPSQPPANTEMNVVPPEAEDSLGADLTGALVDPAEFASAGNRSSWPSLSFSCRAYCARRSATASCCSHEMPSYSNPLYSVNNNNNNSCYMQEGSTFSTERCACCFKCLACELNFARRRCRHLPILVIRDRRASPVREKIKLKCRRGCGKMSSEVEMMFLPKSLWWRLGLLRSGYRRFVWRRQRFINTRRRHEAIWVRGLLYRCMKEEEWRLFTNFMSLVLGGFLLGLICYLLGLIV
uniref:Uncharacterized protein n=1 Tax=Toxocara canis TaxID=6265 RepID=A0A183UZF8_TOXCA